MADRKPFLLRIDTAVLDGVQRWANDDLRSLNAQIEYLLREALRRAGRSSRSSSEPTDPPPEGSREGQTPRSDEGGQTP